jgi:hypothetical protein
MIRGRLPPVYIRPALLQAVLGLTAAAVAVVTIMGGVRIACTALVEFGMLSAVSAVSALVLFARFATLAGGYFADYRQFETWARRLLTLSYLGLAGYALVNGILDLAVPRLESDPASYPGLACLVLAMLVVTLVLETKYRILQITPSRSLLDSLSDDMFYVVVGLITLAALIAHVFAPTWWLDTGIDAIVVGLVGLRLRNIRRREALT